METAVSTGAGNELPDSGHIVSITASRDRAQELASHQGAAKRDWSAALNLINDCFEAVRVAEERAANAENHIAQLSLRLDEQAKTFEARMTAANRRIDAAEARGREAEEWLIRFHDTIMDGFQKTFAA